MRNGSLFKKTEDAGRRRKNDQLLTGLFSSTSDVFLAPNESMSMSFLDDQDIPQAQLHEDQRVVINELHRQVNVMVGKEGDEKKQMVDYLFQLGGARFGR